MVRKFFLLCGLLLLGCAALPAPAAEHPPATAPSVRTIRLADAVPLNELQVEDHQANFTQKLPATQASSDLYFGELDLFDDDDDEKPVDATPIIAVRNDEKYSAVPLVGEGLRKAGWRYVGSGPSPTEIWGAIDAVTDEKRPSFVLAHSTDGGVTFQLRVIHKPCKQAEFFDFAMSQDGHGRVTLSLDTDTGPHKAGLYHFDTTDDGKTWTIPPRFEPDVMNRADSVPDEEQPDAPSASSRTSSAHNRSAGAAVRIKPIRLASPHAHRNADARSRPAFMLH